MEFPIWRIGKGWFDLGSKRHLSLFRFPCTSNKIQNVLSPPPKKKPALFVLLNAHAIQIAQVHGFLTSYESINKNKPQFENCGYLRVTGKAKKPTRQENR